MLYGLRAALATSSAYLKPNAGLRLRARAIEGRSKDVRKAGPIIGNALPLDVAWPNRWAARTRCIGEGAGAATKSGCEPDPSLTFAGPLVQAVHLLTTGHDGLEVPLLNKLASSAVSATAKTIAAATVAKMPQSNTTALRVR